MDAELKALKDNNTWNLVPLLHEHHAVPCGWVFKTKYNPDGSIEKYKARLFFKSYRQEFGIDYFETYAPVTRITSMRVIISLIAHHGLDFHQIDVDSAFLNGFIDAEIYMSQASGYEDVDTPNYVCRLIKSLYGLKQASRIWYFVA
jgi:hypothetical protein